MCIRDSMRDAFEAKFWALDEDRRLPGKHYLEQKLDDIEKNEFRAEPLTEIVSKAEDEPTSLKITWDIGGSTKAVKTTTKVVLPLNPEELRRRLSLMGTAWMFAKSAHANREFLRDLSPQTFLEYTEYLLGDFVMGALAKDARGDVASAPSRELLLSYERNMRKKALEDVRKGSTLAGALKKVTEDPLVKERYFTTPLAHEAMRRPTPSQPAHGNWSGGGGGGSGGARGNKRKDRGSKYQAEG